MKPLEWDKYGLASYEALIESMEVETVIQVDDENYSGDTRVLLKKGDRYGLLFFGWGSCSGCDALQECATVEEATKLRDELWESVEWFEDKEALGRRIATGEWQLKYSWGSELVDFLNRVAEFCGIEQRFPRENVEKAP